MQLNIMIMSGVDDGSVLSFNSENGDGKFFEGDWLLSIGRRDENDLCLRNDTFVSRQHAFLHWRDDRWWLEDCESTNGTFVENQGDFFNDYRIHGIIALEINVLFRVGRTWLRIQPED